MGGQVKTVELLCHLKADVNLCGDDGFSPLMAASLAGHVDAINTLCEHGANVRAVMRDGLNSVYLAAIGGHSRAIRALCDRGADPDAAHYETGFTAAFVAALGGHADAMQALMDKKADVHKRTDKGLTPLQIARLHTHSTLVELLSDGHAAAGKCQMTMKRVIATHKRGIAAKKACR
jgi:ankyrin repeat protein